MGTSASVKPKVATAWLGGCSGCHMSFLDLDERLLDLAGLVELCASPVMDTKEFPEVDIALVEGAVANEEHLESIRTIRKRSRILIAFGDCAVNGNVTALRNIYPKEEVLDRAYRDLSDNIVGIPIGNEVVPKLLDRVKPVHQVVTVDYYLPGCPPSPDHILELLTALLDGRKPEIEKVKFGE